MKRDRLAEARRVQRAAAKLGFDWPTGDPRAWRKLAEEIRELKAVAKNRRRAEEELGDLLFMVVNLSRHLRVDARRALAGATRKFEKRFRHVMKGGRSLPPPGNPRRLVEMEKRWQEAKRKG
jgi:uncharacterized protein YabN with tetrapyrrole methylase and pyrophosphatase domain